MKASLFFLCSFLLFQQLVLAQNVDWIAGDDGQTNPPGKNIGAICPGKAGKLFIAGNFSNSFKISNSPVLNTRGGSDVYLVSMNMDSTVNWTKQIGGAGSDEFDGALATDHWGNIYIAGSFGDSLWIDGQYLLHTGPPAAGFRSDIFMAKFTSSGNLVWLKQTKGFDIESASDIAADSAGNVYLSGTFEYATDFGDSVLVANTGEDDAFLCKYDKDGQLLWKKILQSLDWSHEEITNIEASPDGYVYVAGFYHDTTSRFDGILLSQPTGAGGQLFVAEITPSGSVGWIKYAESFNGSALIQSLRLKDTSLFIAGNFTGFLGILPTLVATAGGNDIFLFSLDPANGMTRWAKSYGNNVQNEMVRHGLQITDGGRILITGDFRDSIRFDNQQIHSGSSRDIYAVVCDSNGTAQHLYRATATGDQLAGAIGADSSGSIYLSGTSLSGSISFGNASLAASDGGIFLAKFVPSTQQLNVTKEKDISVNLFPNPVSDELFWTTTGARTLSVVLYDMSGAVVRERVGGSKNSLSVAGLVPGLYTVRLVTTKGSIDRMIIKR